MNNGYPNNPGFRKGSPDTSSAAAVSISESAASIEGRALRIIRDAGWWGATSDEVADKLGLPNHYAARPRISGLRARKEIADSTRRRTNASGRRAAVWVLPEFAPAKAGVS
ncbi:hypothetical protein KFK14_19720 [Sphingobium phenoxybenzoativorans]|uniref:Uncharacterized protein n=1 Tax=Sphingobium phenoxybenzoativorans TaxID=1592790 RepID=A0A975Q119_9SPHN|nr:hypothetical protein [Sphingobium phenoxybenzoativorans]QUT05201.1 hypothetical protein KFK14_19720 [Sphingobium phenoxybenzoativorans]